MGSADRANPRVDREGPEGPDARLVRDAMVSSPKVTPAAGTVADLRSMFANAHVRTALLVDGAEFVGVVHRDAIPADAPDERPARELARRDVPTVGPDQPLADAVRLLDRTGDNRLVVIDPDGRTLRGLLCLTRDRDGFCRT